MTGAWLALVALLQEPASALARPTIAVTPDTVELTGAGRLAFAPDITAFVLDPSALSGDAFANARLWLDATGKPSFCEERPSPQPQAARIACDQLMRSGRFTLEPGMAMPFRRGFVDVGLAFVPGENRVIVVDRAAYTNAIITYPADETPDSQRLATRDASLAAPPITAEDYPPLAMRNGWESVSALLLGIDQAGRVRTCRPLSNGGEVATAYLDNMSCRIMLRRAHYTFTASAPDHASVRYLRQSFRWTIPRR